jgi:hypothetical protein
LRGASTDIEDADAAITECGQAGVGALAAAFKSMVVRSNIAPKSGSDFAIRGSKRPFLGKQRP